MYGHCSNLRGTSVDTRLLDALVKDLINSTSVDVKIALGNVYLYKRLGIFDLSASEVWDGERSVFRYFPTFNDSRFFFYTNVCWEKLYNYWDRIGDLLWACFDLPIEERNVFFSTVMKELKKTQSGSKNFRELNRIYEGHFQQVLNRSRITVVHYRQRDTDFFFEWLDASTDKERIRELQARRDQGPDTLKTQSDVALEGFGHAVRLIGELNEEHPGKV